jgi:hypothetical protein
MTGSPQRGEVVEKTPDTTEAQIEDMILTG